MGLSFCHIFWMELILNCSLIICFLCNETLKLPQVLRSSHFKKLFFILSFFVIRSSFTFIHLSCVYMNIFDNVTILVNGMLVTHGKIPKET